MSRYHCEPCNETTVRATRSQPVRCPECNRPMTKIGPPPKDTDQIPDVLDYIDDPARGWADVGE